MSVSSKGIPSKNGENTSIEKCSFICHIMILPIGLAYIAWVVLKEETLESWSISYYPPKDWSIYVPVSALLLFLSAPILYAAFNSTTVPRLDSMDALKDDFTRISTTTCSQSSWIAQKVPAEATLPDICDLDPACLVWYHRDDLKVEKTD